MPRFAANLSFLYPDLPFMQRFEAAARDGFAGVEYLFPHEHPLPELAARLRDLGLRQVLFNAPPGDWAVGERGLAALPGREAEFDAAIASARRSAAALGCTQVHVMAGITPPEAPRERLLEQYVRNLRRAARAVAADGLTLLIEPINPRDMPGYVLQRQDEAHALLDAIGEPNVRVQMDLYHCQIVEGDVTEKLRRWLPTGRVAHLQVAGVPGRHEPDAGELNGPWLFDEIDRIADAHGWAGWVGCEYRPARGAEPGGTTAGLGWMRRWVAPQ